jgi:hypothetical protein
MNAERLFGGNPLGVVIRLAILSIVVGIVLSALGLSPVELIERLQMIVRRLFDLSFDTVKKLFEYLLIGAVIVVPVWLISRMVSSSRNKTDR